MPPPSTHFRSQPVANGAVKNLPKPPALPPYMGSFDSVRHSPHCAQDDGGEKVTASQNDTVGKVIVSPLPANFPAILRASAVQAFLSALRDSLARLPSQPADDFLRTEQSCAGPS